MAASASLWSVAARQMDQACPYPCTRCGYLVILWRCGWSHIQLALPALMCLAVDFISLFQRAAVGLKPDGLIFVKENICK